MVNILKLASFGKVVKRAKKYVSRNVELIKPAEEIIADPLIHTVLPICYNIVSKNIGSMKYMMKNAKRYLLCNLYMIQKRKEIVKNSMLSSMVPIFSEIIVDKFHDLQINPTTFIETHIEYYLVLNVAFLIMNTIKAENASEFLINNNIMSNNSIT